MTTFIENPQDYISRHAYRAEVVHDVCGRDGCAALVRSDESHRSPVHGDEYDGRHWNVRRRSPRGGAR